MHCKCYLGLISKHMEVHLNVFYLCTIIRKSDLHGSLVIVYVSFAAYCMLNLYIYIM